MSKLDSSSTMMMCGRLVARLAIIVRRQRLHLARHRAVDIEPAAVAQFRQRHHRRAGEVRDMIDALERLMRLFGNGVRQDDDRGERAAADRRRRIDRGTPSTVEPPERDQQNNADDRPTLPTARRRPGITESRNDRLSGSITITSRNVTVIQVILNLNWRDRDQKFDQRERQRRRDRGPPHDQKPQAIERDPDQQKQALPEQADLGLAIAGPARTGGSPAVSARTGHAPWKSDCSAGKRARNTRRKSEST